MANLVAGSVGVKINIVPGGMSLAGVTCTLIIQSPSGTVSSVPMVVQSDNETAQRVTVATDFPTAGLYTVQVKLVSGGSTLYTTTAPFPVDPALA